MPKPTGERRTKRRWEEAPPLPVIAKMDAPSSISAVLGGIQLPQQPILSTLPVTVTLPSSLAMPPSSAVQDCRLYVGALALEVTPAEVQQLFSIFGNVKVSSPRASLLLLLLLLSLLLTLKFTLLLVSFYRWRCSMNPRRARVRASASSNSLRPRQRKR